MSEKRVRSSNKLRIPSSVGSTRVKVRVGLEFLEAAEILLSLDDAQRAIWESGALERADAALEQVFGSVMEFGRPDAIPELLGGVLLMVAEALCFFPDGAMRIEQALSDVEGLAWRGETGEAR